MKAVATALTVARTSTGVAVGIGSWTFGVAVGTGVTDGAGVIESKIARTVAFTSMGVAVGIGSVITGVIVGAAVSVGTGVNAATIACTVARTSTGVGVTGGGCTHAVTANDDTIAEATAIQVFMFSPHIGIENRYNVRPFSYFTRLWRHLIYLHQPRCAEVRKAVALTWIHKSSISAMRTMGLRVS